MINSPIFFEKNRVARVYTGGKLLGDFLGDDPSDGFYPEEWIASAVRAINKGSDDPKEGVSKPIGSDLYFDELIMHNKYEMLGPQGKLRILVKYLDSAIRLPAQAHPDKDFSRAHFHSEYGKTDRARVHQHTYRQAKKMKYSFRSSEVLRRCFQENCP